MSGNPSVDLSRELAAIRDRFDLQPRDLLWLECASLPCCPNTYWRDEALPRAVALVDAVTRLLDRSPLGDGGSATAATDVAPPTRIRHVRGWWHRRLRRAALVRSFPSALLATPGEVGLVVARTEMALLDRQPWSHADRLLSAFELAHEEIGRRLIGDTTNTPGFFRHA